MKMQVAVFGRKDKNMAVYCVSDIHGDYDKYQKLLKQIHFSDFDWLYVVGDVIDRGKQSVKLLQDMMLRFNVIPIIGNHEYMAISCLRFLMTEITESSLKTISADILQGLLEWQREGGQETIEEFQRLDRDTQWDILDYLEEFSLYEEIQVKGETYVLVHAGLSNFSVDRPLEDYQLHEMIFEKVDYSKVYFPDKYLVTGHIPTRAIQENPRPDFIYKGNRHIAIDCGCSYGGRLGAICLDNGEEFYIE